MALPTKNGTKSYWIEAADLPLRNHRSSETLPEETDVVIIGSGYTGASTAYFLYKVTFTIQPLVFNSKELTKCSVRKGRGLPLGCSCLNPRISVEVQLVEMVRFPPSVGFCKN